MRSTWVGRSHPSGVTLTLTIRFVSNDFIMQEKSSQHLGHHKHKADSHISSKRPSGEGQRESLVLPVVHNPEGETLVCAVRLNSDAAAVSLRQVSGPGHRLLTLTGENQVGVKVSNINELTMLIDALYALGAEWQRRDRRKEAASGDK